jgi:transcriptional regulator with XRE-family HTH domain
VITNQRQYRISKSEADKFANAIHAAEQSGPSEGVHPQIHAAMIEGFRSQLEELQNELLAYEALREGKVRKRSITSLLDLPLVLIEGRIAKRMTQRELALKLKLPEQQVQRYEGTRYAGASLARLQEIADAIGLKLKKVIDFDIPQPATPGSGRARRGGTARVTASRARSRSRGSRVRTPATATRRPASATAASRKSRSRSTGQAKKRASATGRKRTTKATAGKRATTKKKAKTGARKTAKASTRVRKTASRKKSRGGARTRASRSRGRRR